MDIEKLLETLAVGNISDLLLAAGVFPRVRANGILLEEKGYGICNGTDIDAFRLKILGAEGEKSYTLNDGADVSVALTGARRCRINFFTTIHGPGMAVRPLRDGNSVDFENTSLPPLLKEICSEERGLILVRRKGRPAVQGRFFSNDGI